MNSNMNKWQMFWATISAHLTAPLASMELSTRGLYPFDASWQYNKAVGQRTLLIWSLRHCSGRSYLEEYEAGRAKGGTH